MQCPVLAISRAVSGDRRWWRRRAQHSRRLRLKLGGCCRTVIVTACHKHVTCHEPGAAQPHCVMSLYRRCDGHLIFVLLTLLVNYWIKMVLYKRGTPAFVDISCGFHLATSTLVCNLFDRSKLFSRIGDQAPEEEDFLNLDIWTLYRVRTGLLLPQPGRSRAPPANCREANLHAIDVANFLLATL